MNLKNSNSVQYFIIIRILGGGGWYIFTFLISIQIPRYFYPFIERPTSKYWGPYLFVHPLRLWRTIHDTIPFMILYDSENDSFIKLILRLNNFHKNFSFFYVIMFKYLSMDLHDLIYLILSFTESKRDWWQQ